MDFDQKFAALADRLKYGTENGTLSWNLTDRPAAYVVEFSHYTIMIATVDDDGDGPFELTILSDEGTIIDSFKATVADRNMNLLLGPLHETARRNSVGIDRVMDELLSELPERPRGDEPPF
jgi:hypothetical protein